MDEHDGWLNMLVRRAAQEAVGSRQFKGTLVCTGYKKQGHLVKGILVPHGIETGWIQLAAIHAGNGFGIVVGPKVGDAKKLDGDQLDCEFDFGDPNTITARHRQHSNQDIAPEVESGEMLFQHESGNKVLFDKDKGLTVQHHQGGKFVLKEDKTIVLQHASGTNVSWDADGNITHDAKDKSLTIKAAAGVTLNADLTVTGATVLSGTGTLGGLPIATS